MVCSTKEGVPYALLRAAKRAGAPGFDPKGSGSTRVDYDVLGPWIESHRSELEPKVKKAETTDKLKHERLVLDNDLKRLEKEKSQLQNEQLKGRLVDPKKFITWIGSLGAIVSSNEITAMRTLMEQCVGYEDVIKNAFIELIEANRKEFEECKEK